MSNHFLQRAMKKASSHPKLLALLMLSAGLSASAYDFESGGLYYNVLSAENKTVEVTCKDLENIDSYVTGNVVIPETVTDNSTTYTVAAIADWAFGYCTGLTSVTIPNSVTSIGDDAFQRCEALTSVIIPNSVTSIGNWAFASCEALSSVTLPNSVTTIGKQAFAWCSVLPSLTIPSSVTSIGYGMCRGCYKLENINVDPENPNYSSIDGILYDKDATTILGCPGNRESISFPGSVTSIGDSAFSECCKLTTVTIPNSVTFIGHGAFSECIALTSVTIPNSVTYIDDAAFNSCGALTSVTLADGLTWIGGSVFAYCENLTSVTIPNSVWFIGDYAFDECDNLKTVYMQCEVPVECEPGFPATVLTEATLYVPTGTMEAYKGVDPWKNFANIKEMKFNGIEDIDASESEAIRISVENGVLSIGGLDAQTNITIYDMQGRTVYSGQNRSIGGLTRGLYILKVGTKTLKFSI